MQVGGEGFWAGDNFARQVPVWSSASVSRRSNGSRLPPRYATPVNPSAHIYSTRLVCRRFSLGWSVLSPSPPHRHSALPRPPSRSGPRTHPPPIPSACRTPHPVRPICVDATTSRPIVSAHLVLCLLGVLGIGVGGHGVAMDGLLRMPPLSCPNPLSIVSKWPAIPTIHGLLRHLCLLGGCVLFLLLSGMSRPFCPCRPSLTPTPTAPPPRYSPQQHRGVRPAPHPKPRAGPWVLA